MAIWRGRRPVDNSVRIGPLVLARRAQEDWWRLDEREMYSSK